MAKLQMEVVAWNVKLTAWNVKLTAWNAEVMVWVCETDGLERGGDGLGLRN
jgi:hypothetical protein